MAAVKADEAEDKEVSDSTEKKIKYGTFALTIAIGVIVTISAMNPPDILVWINLFAMGGLEATFFWPLLGGLYWKRGNAASCLASIVVGVASFIYFYKFVSIPYGIHAIVIALILSGIAYFAVSMLNKSEPDPDVLENCF